MKTTPFILVFIIFWFTDYYISGYLHPMYKVDHASWDAFVHTRELIYELMFLLLLFLGVFKRTRLSKSLSVFAIVLVASSIVDKKYHIELSYTYYDPVVILFGLFSSGLIYKHARD